MNILVVNCDTNDGAQSVAEGFLDYINSSLLGPEEFKIEKSGDKGVLINSLMMTTVDNVVVYFVTNDIFKRYDDTLLDLCKPFKETNGLLTNGAAVRMYNRLRGKSEFVFEFDKMKDSVKLLIEKFEWLRLITKAGI